MVYTFPSFPPSSSLPPSLPLLLPSLSSLLPPPSLSSLHLPSRSSLHIPLLSFPPATYIVNEGEEFTLSCADNNGSSYMWKRNGIEIEGAEDATLVISHANHTLHNGTFTCTVFLKDSTQIEFEYIVLVYCE